MVPTFLHLDKVSGGNASIWLDEMKSVGWGAALGALAGVQAISAEGDEGGQGEGPKLGAHIHL